MCEASGVATKPAESINACLNHRSWRAETLLRVVGIIELMQVWRSSRTHRSATSEIIVSANLTACSTNQGYFMQTCGGCKHFLKIKNLAGNSGLCVLFDRRTDTDRGHNCQQFKRVKFHRAIVDHNRNLP